MRRAIKRAVQSSPVCEQQSDLARILQDLVREHGRAFSRRACFQDATEPHRQRVFIAPGHELWLLSWVPGQITPIHDHGGAVTVTTVLSGSVLEERFVHVREREVRPSWTMVRRPGDLDPIEATAIHRVRPLTPTVTLHLHVPACLEGQIYQVSA
jgi:hypothetical protein